MKTKDAIKLAGSAAALSRVLNITQSAVCQWKEDVPELSLFRMMALKPEWFHEIKTANELAESNSHTAQEAMQSVAVGVA